MRPPARSLRTDGAFAPGRASGWQRSRAALRRVPSAWCCGSCRRCGCRSARRRARPARSESHCGLHSEAGLAQVMLQRGAEMLFIFNYQHGRHGRLVDGCAARARQTLVSPPMIAHGSRSPECHLTAHATVRQHALCHAQESQQLLPAHNRCHKIELIRWARNGGARATGGSAGAEGGPQRP